MPTNAPQETCATSDYSILIREYLGLYGELYRQEISSTLAPAWERLLGDILLTNLARALERAARECRFFPTPAEIRALAGENNKHQLQLEAARDQLDAERAWDSLLRYIEQWGADLAPLFHGRDANGDPILERPEPLPPEVAWAVQQCGGYRAVANAESDKLHFIRKDFIRHYSRHRETDQLRVPSREEAKQLVSRVDGWRKKLVEQPRPPLVKRSS